MPIFIPPSDPMLNQVAAAVPVNDISSDEVQAIIDRLLAIAQDNQVDLGNGVMVGLAAPQIGIAKRIVVVDTHANEARTNLGNVVPFINPQITWCSDEIAWGTEGCYSVDEHLDGKIPRFQSVRITAYDRHGHFMDAVFTGFTARIFQHEIDHLDGIRFPDRVGEDGVLHWVPDNQSNRYLEEWKNWPLQFPWQMWLNMKEGKPYSPPVL